MLVLRSGENGRKSINKYGVIVAKAIRYLGHFIDERQKARDQYGPYCILSLCRKKASVVGVVGGFDPVTAVSILINYPGKIAAGGGTPSSLILSSGIGG
jgi:hypothetical protein